ncbi:MAG: FecR family protein [Candidatus Cyclobacteriaceae bacterium M3_2C_046]
MKKKDSDIIWLLQQAEFKQWVINPTRESDLFWQKWLSENPDLKTSLEKARELVLRLYFKAPELKADEKNEMLDKIISASFTQPSKSRFKPWDWLQVAAILAVLISITIVFTDQKYTIQGTVEKIEVDYVVKENPNGTKSSFTLPDGSRVSLNAASCLRFPRQFSDSNRQVELKGEAFFEVVKNEHKPFSVKTGDVITTAIGTSFNVRSYPDQVDVNVALVNGLVKVTKTDHDSTTFLLKPGEKVRFYQGYEELSDFNKTMEMGWKEGILVFKNASFNDFIRQTERWFGVVYEIQGDLKKDWNIDGRFDNESLEEILTGLSFSKGLNYNINGQKVIIELKE